MTDLDVDVMGRLLVQVEADIHREGWDGRPRLLLLYAWREDDAEMVYRQILGRFGSVHRLGPYAARPMVPSTALLGNPAHGVFRLALNLSTDDERVMVMSEGLRHPGFRGVAVVTETWRQEMDPDERQALGKVRFADLPGSVEARLVAAATVGPQDFQVERRRGAKPQLQYPRADVVDLDGAVVQSLRLITAVIADLPRPELTGVPSDWSWDDQVSMT